MPWSIFRCVKLHLLQIFGHLGGEGHPRIRHSSAVISSPGGAVGIHSQRRYYQEGDSATSAKSEDGGGGKATRHKQNFVTPFLCILQPASRDHQSVVTDLLISSSSSSPAMIALTLFGGYVLTSVLLFKFPTILHRKKQLKFHCRHISHRGGAGENLENTMTAFQHALQQGTDMFEIDLQLTKDGKVVISHDNYLYRSTGQHVCISDLNYDELPPLKSTLPIDFAKGQVCQSTSSDRRIPLLSELFEQFPDMPVNIDIKVDNDELIRKVEELIRQYKREDITVWGNFGDTVTSKCYKANPNIPILFSAQRVVLLLVLTYTGLLPFVPLRESCLELFMPCVVSRNPVFREIKKKYVLSIMLWAVDKLLMRKVLFEHLSKRGIQTYLWVLNEEEQIRKAFELGATGVMTDFPTKLRKYLDENPVNS